MSIYLHCDNTASHYIKVLADSIFGKDGFRNEIVWCYGGGAVSKNDFAKKHDNILRYATGVPVFNVENVRMPYTEASIRRKEIKVSRHTGNYVYRPNPAGKHPVDWWTDITPLASLHKERVQGKQTLRDCLDDIEPHGYAFSGHLWVEFEIK